MSAKNNFEEIEFKYDASNVTLTEFKRLAKSYNPKEVVESGGFDHYYTKGRKMLRYRAGDRHELTLKEKLVEENNFIRTELNIRMVMENNETAEDMLAKANQLASMLDFKHNFTIFKCYFVYIYENYNLVYYIVYDQDMKERNRFMEIEMSESYPWKEREAWQTLGTLESILSGDFTNIGFTKRINESLFEMYLQTSKK